MSSVPSTFEGGKTLIFVLDISLSLLSARTGDGTPLHDYEKALTVELLKSYAGISSYGADLTRRAAGILKHLGTPCLIHQPVYNMFNRWVEPELLGTLQQEGIGCIVFSPLAQGLLAGRYLEGIPADSRAAKPHGFLRVDQITEEKVRKARSLNELARSRGQTLAQMAVAWVLRHPAVTSALVGASSVEQLEETVGALRTREFSAEELAMIDTILSA